MAKAENEPGSGREKGDDEAQEVSLDTRLAGIEKALGQVAEIVTVQNEQIADLRARQEATEGVIVKQAAPGPPPEELVTGLPEGVTRFMSPITNYRLVYEHGAQMIVNNRPVSVPQKTIEFANGIYDTKDPEIVAFLRSHDDYGTDFIEDPTARPRTGARVVEGPRGTGGVPAERRPDAALAARA